MIAVPSIAMIGLLAMLSMVAATILRRPWQRWVALGCAIFETAIIGFLIFTVLT